MKRRCHKGRKGERGQVLLLVLILMLLGGLIITPLLSYMSTGLMSGRVFENKADELYAADSGVEDGLWQIKNDQLYNTTKFPGYNPYDYSTSWSYNLAETMNGKNVNVNIRNMWIPKDLTAPDKTSANQIINGINNQPPKLIVTGTVNPPSTYTIKLSYYPTVGESFTVSTVGVWLPPGFTYVAGSSNLEANPAAPYYSVPVNSTWRSGQAVVWSFSSVLFTSFPGVNQLASPMVSAITFNFSAAQSGQSPAAVSWINTSLDLGGGYHYAWDADKKVYQITSTETPGNTITDAYAIKLEVRQLGSAISGDYCASGNTLMRCTTGDSAGTRDTLDPSSTANISTIPQNAQVAAAYLYWSAWRSESAKQTPFSDPCSSNSSFNTNWVNGGDWAYYSSDYRAHHSGTSNSTRYLTLKNSLNLSTYVPGAVTVSWQQAEDGTVEADDALQFSFSGDGGITWSINTDAFRDDIGSSWVSYSCIIPSQYLTSGFKIRFYIDDFGDSNDSYCYIDNINIVAMPPDTSVIFKIDGQQVYFDASGNPQKGAQEITASRSQVLPNYDENGNPNGFSYSCYKDVTKLVQAYSAKAPNPATNYPGNGIYTGGGVTGNTGNQWSYAGWSLIIIYTGPTTLGHQLYLFDTFLYGANYSDINFGAGVVPYGGTINGFLVPERVGNEVNAAQLTACVAEGDYCWSGDFIAFNAPSSYWNSTSSNPWSIPDPTPSQPWKLWDGIILAAPTTSGDVHQPNNAGHPDNVWNSHPADGMDIKTFSITWASGLLKPGDTSAHVDLPTCYDSWNLVYMILSFRSATTTGGTISYLIRG